MQSAASRKQCLVNHMKPWKKWGVGLDKSYKLGVGRVGRGGKLLSSSWMPVFPSRTEQFIRKLGLLRCCFHVQFILRNLVSFGELQMNCYLLCVNTTLEFLAYRTKRRTHVLSSQRQWPGTSLCSAPAVLQRNAPQSHACRKGDVPWKTEPLSAGSREMGHPASSPEGLFWCRLG